MSLVGNSDCDFDRNHTKKKELHLVLQLLWLKNIFHVTNIEKKFDLVAYILKNVSLDDGFEWWGG